MTKPAASANRKTAKQKAAAKSRPQTWKPGQSGNPKGAPKRGESWAEIIKRVGEMTPSEAAAQSIELAKQYLSAGDGVTLKQAVIMRVYGALLFDPQPGLLNAFMERTEGKVKDMQVNIDLAQMTPEQLQRIADGEDVYDILAASGRGAPGITETPATPDAPSVATDSAA